MTDYVEYLIEHVQDGVKPIVYKIEIDEEKDWVSLLTGDFIGVPIEVFAGLVIKRSKRGVTYRTFLLTPKSMDVFLDRGSFQFMNKEDFADWKAKQK